MTTAERKQREREERKALIVSAAEAVFVRNGFDLATMDEVAQQAELGKGTLYLYFKTKDELLLAVSEKMLAALAARLGTATSGTGADRLHALATVFAEFAFGNPAHFRLAMTWLLGERRGKVDARNLPAWRATVGQLFERLAHTIRVAQTDGSVTSNEHADILAVRLWGQLVGLLLVSLADEQVRLIAPEVDSKEFVHSAVRSMLHDI